MTTTIWESFDETVYQFELLGLQTETPVKASGTHTERCTPPRCGIMIPVQHWIDIASRFCLDRYRNDLKADYLPKINRSIKFKSEADVVAASALYLTYPVHTACELVYPDITILNQVTRPGKYMVPSSRADIVYFSGQPSDERAPGNSENIFAVMEYKKFDGLSRDQFNRGIVSDYDAYASTPTLPRFSDERSKTSMILKQATHYAWRFNSRFVALCDYKTLVLLVMATADERFGGAYTYMTVIWDQSQMRKAYLGFLLAAKSHKDNRSDWRMNREGEDVFGIAERWDQQLRSGEPQRKKARITRNPKPTHVAPNSDDGGIEESGS